MFIAPGWLRRNIELKADKSNEKITDIVNQIKGYAGILPSLIPALQEEFKNKFFLDIKFTNNIHKMILAPREFFSGQEKSSYPSMKEMYLHLR